MPRYHDMTKRQQSAFSLAKRMLKKRPWYRGVCTNTMPSDADIKAKGRYWAAHELWMETWYHDGQWWNVNYDGDMP